MLTPVEQKLFRAEEGDTQCASIGKNGQCPYQAVPGGTNCERHKGGAQVANLKASSLRAYRLMQWQDRCQEFADDSEIKSLRGELAISRMTLEEIIKSCKTPNELLLMSGKITIMVEQIRKLVVSCQNLEGQLGVMLDKNQVMKLGAQLVEIIGNYVKDPATIDKLSLEIGTAILEMSPSTEVELNER